MDELKYKGFKLGKATEVIAKTMKVICIIIWFLALLGSMSKEKNFDIWMLLIAVLFGILGYWLLKKLFNPIINIHKNTIRFTTNEIRKDFYRKKWRNSMIASIIFSVLFFLPTISISLWAMIPLYIFLAKTKPLLLQGYENVNQEEQNDVTEIIL